MKNILLKAQMHILMISRTVYERVNTGIITKTHHIISLWKSIQFSLIDLYFCSGIIKRDLRYDSLPVGASESHSTNDPDSERARWRLEKILES